MSSEEPIESIEPSSQGHSNFVASVFVDTKTAIEVFSTLMPKEVTENINWPSLKVVNGSFVNKKLKSYYSDLLFKVTTKDDKPLNLYLLFEHKSHPDKNVLTQLLSYQTEIYINQKEYEPVLPIVFYHGQEKWLIDEKFGKQLNENDDYTLNFKYVLIDVSKLNLNQFKISLTTKATLHILQSIWYFDDNDVLANFIVEIAELLSSEDNVTLLQKMFMYVYSLHSIEPIEMYEMIEAVAADKGGMAMTTAERLINQGMQQGIQQGIQQGMQQGMQQGRYEGERAKARLAARRLLMRGISLDIITDATGLTEKEIRDIQAN